MSFAHRELKAFTAQYMKLRRELMSQIIIFSSSSWLCFLDLLQAHTILYPPSSSRFGQSSLYEAWTLLCRVQAFHSQRRRLQKEDWTSANSLKHRALLETMMDTFLHAWRRILNAHLFSDRKYLQYNMPKYIKRFFHFYFLTSGKKKKSIDAVFNMVNSRMLIIFCWYCCSTISADCCSHIYLSNYSGSIVSIHIKWGYKLSIPDVEGEKKQKRKRMLGWITRV